MSVHSIPKTVGVVLLAASVMGCAAPIEETPRVDPLSVVDKNQLSTVSIHPLKVSDAVRFGVLAANNVLTSDYAVEQRRNDIVIARAAFFPEFYFNLAPSTEAGEIAMGSAGLRYTLWDFGERAARLNAARASTDRAQYELLAEVDETVLNSIEEYIDYSVNIEQTRAARKFLSSISGLNDRVRSRVEIGIGSAAELNQIETGRLDARAEIVDAEAAELNALEALSSRIGVRPRSVLSLGKLRSMIKAPAVPKEIKLIEYPKIAALHKTVLEKSYGLKASQAGLFPRLGLKVGVGVDLEDGGSLINNGLAVGPDISNVYSLGGGRKEKVRNAELDLFTAKENLNEEARIIQLDLQRARNGVSASNDRVGKRRKVLSLARETRDVMLSEYEFGSRSLSELIDAEERIYDAGVALNEAYRDLLKDRVALMRATNKLSGTFYAAPK